MNANDVEYIDLTQGEDVDLFAYLPFDGSDTERRVDKEGIHRVNTGSSDGWKEARSDADEGDNDDLSTISTRTVARSASSATLTLDYPLQVPHSQQEAWQQSDSQDRPRPQHFPWSRLPQNICSLIITYFFAPLTDIERRIRPFYNIGSVHTNEGDIMTIEKMYRNIDLSWFLLSSDQHASDHCHDTSELNVKTAASLRSWTYAASRAFYSTRIFIFDCPFLAKWWITRIGATNVQHIREIHLVMQDGMTSHFDPTRRIPMSKVWTIVLDLLIRDLRPCQATTWNDMLRLYLWHDNSYKRSKEDDVDGMRSWQVELFRTLSQLQKNRKVVIMGNVPAWKAICGIHARKAYSTQFRHEDRGRDFHESTHSDQYEYNDLDNHETQLSHIQIPSSMSTVDTSSQRTTRSQYVRESTPAPHDTTIASTSLRTGTTKRGRGFAKGRTRRRVYARGG